jgi:predicted transcriptional regulator
LFQELNPPRGCSQHIYELAREHLGLGFSKIIILIKKGLVCQNGHCYDLGDVGSNL